MNEELLRLGREIRKHRKKKKLNQEELSEKSGVSRSYISDLERGERSPGFEVVKKLATALGVTIDELSASEPEGEGEKLPEEKVELVKDILKWHMLFGQRINNSECREMMARDIVKELEE